MGFKYEVNCPCGASIKTNELFALLTFRDEHTGEHALAIVAIIKDKNSIQELN